MLPVFYTPTATGLHTATLSIYDGGLPASIRVNLRGEGCKVPTLSTPLALPATNITRNSYTACWQESPETVDYYILYRTRYLPDGEETDELQAAGTTLEITDYNPEIAESYRVVASRLGYLSAYSNRIFVDEAGVASTEAEPQASIGWEKGGFVMLTSLPEVKALRVYDLTGRMLLTLSGLRHGDFIPLSPGIYLLEAEELGKPVKYISE